MPDPLVVCIVLNHKRRDDTLACLNSLYNSSYTSYKVIVLDNQSRDGTIEVIHAAYPEAQVIELEQNRGYAGNNNLGICMARELHADWVFILNEDTIVDPHCIEQLVQAGESSPEIGFTGPMVYHFDEPAIIQSGGGMLGEYWQSIHIEKDMPDTGQLPDAHSVEWITGCAMLARMKMIEQVGALDENFFTYWEETEWCFRAGRAGWRIVHVPAAKIWHKGVQRNYAPKPSLFYYITRNRLLMLSKHHAPLKVWIHTIIEIARTLVSWSVRPKWRGKRADRNAMWQGLIDFLRHRWGKQESSS